MEIDQDKIINNNIIYKVNSLYNCDQPNCQNKAEYLNYYSGNKRCKSHIPKKWQLKSYPTETEE